LTILPNYAVAVAFSDGLSAGFSDVFEAAESEDDFLVELELLELELDSESLFGRLSVMYQPDPLKTTPTG
jgi:hypothetical protein